MTTPHRPPDVGGLVAHLVEGYEDGRTNAPLLERVRELVVPGAGPAEERKTLIRKAPHAPSPVADGALHLVDEVEAAGLAFEVALRRELGFAYLYRTRTRANADRALRALPALAEALGLEHDLTVELVDVLGRLHNRATGMTGHRQPWLKVPEPCPECGAKSLRQRPEDGAVVCFYGPCREDNDGQRREWAQHELRWVGRLIEAAAAEGSP